MLIQPTQKAARLISGDGVDALRHAIAADSIRLLSGASRLPSSGFTRQNLGKKGVKSPFDPCLVN
jgi:hypothetical protein